MKILSFQQKIIITVILFVLFYVLFAIFSDIEKIKENYQQIKLIYLAPIFGILTLSIFLRSLLQRFLLKALGIDLSVKNSFILFWSGLSMLVTPLGSGQMIKSHFIEQKYGHPVAQSLPLVFAERFFDFSVLTGLVILSLLAFHSTESLIIAIVSLIIITGLFLTIRSKRFFHIIEVIANKIHLFRKLIPMLSQFDDSMGKVLHYKVVMVGFLMATLAYSMEGFVIYLGFLSFNINLGYLHTIQIYFTSILFGTLSFIPGGVGVLEGTFVKLMMRENFELSLITSLVIFIRLTVTWYSTIVGFVASYFMKINKKVV